MIIQIMMYNNLTTLVSSIQQEAFQAIIQIMVYNNNNLTTLVSSVVGVIKMGNIVPRAGIEPKSLTFWANVLPLHHVGSLMSSLYPCTPVYVATCLGGQCRLLQQYLKRGIVGDNSDNGVY